MSDSSYAQGAQTAASAFGLTKQAIYTFAHRALPQPRAARVGGRSFQEFAQTAQRRYGVKAPRFAQAAQDTAAAMQKVNPTGAGVKRVTLAPDLVDSYNDRTGRVELSAPNPATAGHEVGHAVDAAQGASFGNRGIFGFGGNIRSQLPSEGSATRQALQALGRQDGGLASATGTYVEMSAPRIQKYMANAFAGAAQKQYPGLPAEPPALARLQRAAAAHKANAPSLEAAKASVMSRSEQVQTELRALADRKLDLQYRDSLTPEEETQLTGILQRMGELEPQRWLTPSHPASRFLPYAQGDEARAFHRDALAFKLRQSGEDSLQKELEMRAALTNPVTNPRLLEHLTPRQRTLMDRWRKAMSGRLERTIGVPGAAASADAHVDGLMAQSQAQQHPAVAAALRHFGLGG